MNVGTAELVQIISGGGVLAFAGAVYLELRTQRAERHSHEETIRELLTEHRTILAALLERLRLAPRRADTGPILVDSEGNEP